jgi:hypothetical protein
VRYGWTIAADAMRDLQSLEAWLQEEVLDEVEGVAADPSILPASFSVDPISYRISRIYGGATHYLALTISRNDLAKTISVLGVSRRVA